MTRALIIIDVQNEYVTGALPVAYPPIDSSLANVGRAMDAAHEAGVPVVVIQHDAPADSPVFAEGGDSWQLHTVVSSRPSDATFHKQLPGSFTGTGLGDWLDERGIDTVSIAGYMTNICVDTTSRQAAHRGMAVEVLSDATGTLAYSNTAGTATAEQVHHATLATLHAAFGAVVTTDEWTAALGGPAIAGSNLLESTSATVATP